jgi:hypothetical protein
MLNSAENNTDLTVYSIPANEVLSVMPGILPMLETVVKPDTGHTIENVISSLLLGQKQLWIIGDFVALTITHVQQRPTETTLWVDWLVGNDMPKWVVAWMEFQERMACEIGCNAIEFNGRIGYKKFEKLYKKCKPIRTLYRQEV